MSTPPSLIAPYDNWGTIFNAANARLGKKMPSLYTTSGALMSLPQETSRQLANNAWRRLQDGMVDCGSKRFQSEVFLYGIPSVSGSTDPSLVCQLSWGGFTDPYGNVIQSWALPSDLMYPLWLSERWTGNNLPFPSPNKPNMNPRPDGIPRYQKQPYNGTWQWKQDAIFFPGATYSMDFWVYYRNYLPDATDVAASARWWDSPVQIMRCQDPLAWWVCREYAVSMSVDPNTNDTAAAKWGTAAAGFEAQAIDATKKLVNRDFDIDNRGPGERRRPYGGGGGGGNSWGGFGGLS